MNPLKSTSLAILGQLALKPWSAYELIQEMQRNFHYFWPKAESGLYNELKLLEKEGLVTSQTEQTGKKKRSVYSITPTGRVELENWLQTEPAEFKLEFEGLLRVFLGRLSPTDALENTLSKVDTDADVLIALAEKIGHEYLEGKAPFQEEVSMRAFVFDFLIHYAFLYREWADRVRKTTANWDQLPRVARDKAAVEHIRNTLDKLLYSFNGNA